jgi:hypothetical protein
MSTRDYGWPPMSAGPNDSPPSGFQAGDHTGDDHTGDLIRTYAGALTAHDAETALNALSADAVFHSPFHAWRGHHVPSAYRARCEAFDNLLVSSVIRDRDQAVIFWSATVGGAQVEAAERVLIGDGTIVRVDVFLRPADVLDTVHQAMVAAWL